MEHIILFDLDGTLTDPEEGITKSVQHALRAFGIEEPHLEALRPFIGPPLTESFMELYGFSEADARAAIPHFREYFAGRGIFENRPYEGIREMLEGLCGDGFTLAVATSKPEVFAEQILEHFGLRRYFKLVGGADMEEKRVKKGEVIAWTLERLGVDPKKTPVLMVGDRKHDAAGAKKNGIPCAGVLFGYGTRKELAEAGVDYLADSVEKLGEILRLWGKGQGQPGVNG